MTTNEKRLLDLSKKMFKHYTGIDMEFAKELIAIEEELMIGETSKANIKEPVKETPKVEKSVIVEPEPEENIF